MAQHVSVSLSDSSDEDSDLDENSVYSDSEIGNEQRGLEAFYAALGAESDDSDSDTEFEGFDLAKYDIRHDITYYKVGNMD